MTLDELNNMSEETLIEHLKKCCGSEIWAKKMIAYRPFESEEILFHTADTIWWKLKDDSWLEAFSHHPKIGENIESLKEKFSKVADWSSTEQKGVESASEETLKALQDLNQQYFDKFGFVFLICATGKSAEEMLESLKSRLNNERSIEIRNAAKEQGKITVLRLEKLFNE